MRRPRTVLLLLAVSGVAVAGISCSKGDVSTDGGAGGRVAGGGGAAGGGGSAADGGADVTGAGGMLERGPKPATAGHAFPFPQNRELPGCTYPTNYNNDHVRAAYEQWKTNTVTSNGAGGFRRITRPHDPAPGNPVPADATVSEGIGYGMIIAVYMDDQALFDDLWKYEQLHLDGSGLMHWDIGPTGTTHDTGAATDADEDMAWALVMADKQWGTSPTLGSYLNIAKDLIGKIWNNEVEKPSNVLKPGDGWGGKDVTNPSYFAPAYYKVFAQVTGNTGWNNVVTTSYQILDAAVGSRTNGLVPAWCKDTGAIAQAPGWHQYDSCRTPFRIALDWCYFGDARAKAYLQKTSSFFSAIGAANVQDGYDLNGTPHPSTLDGASGTGHIKLPGLTGNEAFIPGVTQSSAVLGPAGVGSMIAPSYSTFLNDVYTSVATLKLQYGGVYYDDSWAVMSLLMMTGNFLNYTAL